jgi:hypothetical protein
MLAYPRAPRMPPVRDGPRPPVRLGTAAAFGQQPILQLLVPSPQP